MNRMPSGLIVVLLLASTLADQTRADEAVPPSFARDVQPLLTKLGCNQGACHGKLAGQNGFRLSLRGFAPDWDHFWITREPVDSPRARRSCVGGGVVLGARVGSCRSIAGLLGAARHEIPESLGCRRHRAPDPSSFDRGTARRAWFARSSRSDTAGRGDRPCRCDAVGVGQDAEVG